MKKLRRNCAGGIAATIRLTSNRAAARMIEEEMEKEETERFADIKGYLRTTGPLLYCRS